MSGLPIDLGPGMSEYKLIERLGQGSFAEVYRAEAPGGIPVAIKRVFKSIDQKEAQRELQALETVKKLHHPFLLATHAYWLNEDRLFIVMDLADCTLRDRLRDCRKQQLSGIPLEELLRYIDQAAQAIDFLHSRGVLHRDIKPENILLQGAYAKVGDFGLARGLGGEQLSATGAGTPRYMAPEAWQSRATVSKLSDQYSLALTYAELRLDRWPFQGQSLVDVMMDHLYNAPDLSPLPEAEQNAVLRALAKEPGQRFGSCQEFVRALYNAIGLALSISGPPVVMPPPEPIAAPEAPVPAQPSGGVSAVSTVVPTKPEVPVPTPTTPVTTTAREESSLGEWATIHPSATPRTEEMAHLQEAEEAVVPVEVLPPTEPVLPEKRRRRTRLPYSLLALGLLIGGLAYIVWKLLPPSPGFALDLEGLHRLSPLKAGQMKEVEIGVRRDSVTGPIRLTFPELPPGVRIALADPSPAELIEEAIIPADRQRIKVRVLALPDAQPGEGRITTRAEAEGHQPQEGAQPLSIGPLAYALPADWVKPAEAVPRIDADRHVYYDRIDVVKGGIAVRFLLIPRGERDEPISPLPPFYIMADKVWVGLFKAFATQIASQWPLSREWENMGRSTLPVNKDDDHPVMGVIFPDAQACATWLGGALPTPRQWDKASGRFASDRKEGPYIPPIKPGEDIAVDRTKDGTMKRGSLLGDQARDRSLFGVWDMSGNGVEWTSEILAGGAEESVVQRGCAWSDPKPFTFMALEDNLKEGGQWRVEFKMMSSPGTGFRVVLNPSRASRP